MCFRFWPPFSVIILIVFWGLNWEVHLLSATDSLAIWVRRRFAIELYVFPLEKGIGFESRTLNSHQPLFIHCNCMFCGRPWKTLKTDWDPMWNNHQNRGKTLESTSKTIGKHWGNTRKTLKRFRKPMWNTAPNLGKTVGKPFQDEENHSTSNIIMLDACGSRHNRSAKNAVPTPRITGQVATASAWDAHGCPAKALSVSSQKGLSNFAYMFSWSFFGFKYDFICFLGQWTAAVKFAACACVIS